MMKKYLLLFTLAFCAKGIHAQELHCATDAVMTRLYEQRPDLKVKHEQMEAAYSQHLGQARTSTVSPSYTIPIVFHILHLGGAENIPDSQVVDAVRILNRDFAKRNADTTDIIPEFKNIADSASIHFKLATIDPNGNCTNGIIHHYDPDTDWNDQSATIYAYTWDPTKYMNVYLVRTITLTGGFPAAGYTFYPGTWPAGDPWDAIVVLHNYVGSVGTGNNYLSRVLTHETGHWFNLGHIFGMTNGAGVNCNDDDNVSDTPPTMGYLSCPNVNVPAQYQICTPGVSENFQNYMDYSYCCRMFTAGQCQRMQSTMQLGISNRDNLSMATNLQATGLTSPMTACVPLAGINANRLKVCVGTPVYFTDNSWNGTPATYSWTFSGGSPATSTVSSPVVTYATPGTYTVSHRSGNAAGTSTAVTTTITVVSNTATISNAWTDSFENATFNTDWTLGSTSGTALWQRNTAAAAVGICSVKIPQQQNTRLVHSWMISPSIDLSTINSPVLSFKVASAESGTNRNNKLKLHISTDCGNTWTELYSKASPLLVTTTSTNNTNFIPIASQWRTETINLAAYQSQNYVTFKFEYIRDTISPANNTFIDAVNLSGSTGFAAISTMVNNLSVFPIPSKGALTLAFELATSQNIKFSVMDILGRELENLGEQAFEAGSHSQSFQLKTRTPGVYFLKVTAGGSSSVHKIILEE